MKIDNLIAAMLLAGMPVALFADNAPPTSSSTASSSSSSSTADDVSLYTYSMQDYYGIPVNDINHIKEKGLAAEEIPVVLFFVKNGKATIDQVLEHRQKGEKWVAIAESLDIKPSMIFVPVNEEVTGARYGRAYGYFKTQQIKSWKWVTLEDEEFVNLVNLKFLSRLYLHAPSDIIKKREAGSTFMAMNSDLNDQKYRMPAAKESDKPATTTKHKK
jgi:hypothetical protein